MRYLLTTLPLALILSLLLGGAVGCGESHSPILAQAEKSIGDPLPPTVDGIAAWHNRRVEELVQSCRAGAGEALPGMETILERWGCLEGVDLPAARRDWHQARTVIEGGLRPEDLENLVARGLERAAADPDVSPRFLEQLRLCLGLLLSGERDGLFPAVHRLADMARSEGSAREKGLAGVLLGSLQRATVDKSLPPDHPYYPIIVGYDEVGTMFGGPVIGALYSAQIEITIIFSSFPWMWW